MGTIPMTSLVAHRGYQRLYPENSLLALRKAIEHGARYIETDVLFSADGVPVLYHDTLMQRLSGLEGAVHMEQASTLFDTPLYEPDRLGDRFIGETIAPLTQLTELLQQHPSVTAFVEMKRAGLLHMGTDRALITVLDVLRPVLDRVVLISFDYAAMNRALELGFSRIGMVLVEWSDATADAVIGNRPEWIFCDTEKVPDTADLASLPAAVALYEVTDNASAHEWLARGATAVETFDIVAVAAGPIDGR